MRHETVRRSSRFGLAHVRNTKPTTSPLQNQEREAMSDPTRRTCRGVDGAASADLQATKCAHVAVTYKATNGERFNQIRASSVSRDSKKRSNRGVADRVPTASRTPVQDFQEVATASRSRVD